jgi:2'-5' RNA ligase
MDVSGQKTPSKKYFIAIVLPPPVLQVAEAIKLELFEKYGLKAALRSPAHITLHRPFEWKENKEEKLIATLQEFSLPKSFEICLRNFSFFEPRVLFMDVVKNETLDGLHDRLKRFAQRELQLFNEVEDLRGFHPHVTLAFRDLKKPLFYRVQDEFRDKNLEACFNCGKISLLKLGEKWEILHDFILPG